MIQIVIGEVDLLVYFFFLVHSLTNIIDILVLTAIQRDVEDNDLTVDYSAEGCFMPSPLKGTGFDLRR